MSLKIHPVSNFLRPTTSYNDDAVPQSSKPGMEPGLPVLKVAGDQALETQKASSVSDVANNSDRSDGTRTSGLPRDGPPFWEPLHKSVTLVILE